jgi:GGDEF domain-containing protein
MAIEPSIAGVVRFLRDNDNLIKQVMESAEGATTELSAFAEKVDQAKEEAKMLVDQLGGTEFTVAAEEATKVRQKALLEAIEVLRKKFETYRNDPLRRGIYAAEISNLHVQLAGTFNSQTIASMCPFEEKEIAKYRELLKKAAMDAADRKKRAAVLKAAAQVSKIAIGVAGKLV